MIEDTPTQTSQPQETTPTEEFDPSEGNLFVSSAAESSRRLTSDERYAQAANQNLADIPTPAEDPKGWSRGQKIGVGLAIAGAAALGAGSTAAVIDHIVPGQEVASATSTINPGEGLEQSVDRDIARIESQKIDPADTTERQDVISQAVTIHSDENAIVQPGENVTVIAEKSPIFGNITYKAVPNDERQQTVNEQVPVPPVVDSQETIPSPETH